MSTYLYINSKTADKNLQFKTICIHNRVSRLKELFKMYLFLVHLYCICSV